MLNGRMALSSAAAVVDSFELETDTGVS
jgi:hypothetical protein